MIVPISPRALSQREAAILLKLLAEPFAGASGLRAQIPYTLVVAHWSEMSPSVDLDIRPGIASAGPIHGIIPVVSEVRDESGSYVGEIIIWATHGYLSGIEYAVVVDDRPRVLPDPQNVEVRLAR
ncbi:hypothetical protein [Nocardia aurea]|uniref:hypothetical protein n=1 Tax=Nocardia aurea TaxID=2144174 RepID=UPI0033A2DC29